MAEYKNGFNYRGNMSVEKEDYAPDVQTGRAVFVDEDKYTNDASYKAKVDKCVAEGFHWISEGDTPSGGGVGTALIIREDHVEQSGDVTTIYYDKTYEEVYDAYDAGLPIYLQQGNATLERLPLISVTDGGLYSVKFFDFKTMGPITMAMRLPGGYLYREEGGK